MPLLAWLALVAAVVFWARRSGRRAAAWAAACGWLGLPVYEWWLRRNCGGDCGIRIDLLVVLPLLLVLTLTALWKAWRGRRP